MKPERQFWGWVLLLCVGLFALVGGQALLFYLHHEHELYLLPPRLRANLLVFLGVALLSVLPFLVWGMRLWYRRYVLPLHRISEDVEALVYGSPHARITTEDDDPAGLAALLNALMERYQHGEQAVEERLEATRGELSAETTRLESLLDALVEGVVLCAPEGRILRHNRAARRLFGERAELGVGKPVTELIEPTVWDYARETLQEQLSTGVVRPHVHFECRNAGTAPLRARIAPLLVYGGRLEGFVLTIHPEDDGATAVTAPQAMASGAAPAAEAAPATAPLPDWEQRPLSDLRFVVFDTETTGLNPGQGDAVIALGAVAVASGRILPDERVDALVDPARPISPAAQRVHGLTAEALAGRPRLEAILPAFVQMARESVLVGHNVAFDLAFLRPAVAAAGLQLEQPVLDTMLLSSVLHPVQPSHSLDSLLRRYGIPVEARHSALGDAQMTAELLLVLIPQLERRGIVTLGDALSASRRSPLARLSYSR